MITDSSPPRSSPSSRTVTSRTSPDELAAPTLTLPDAIAQSLAVGPIFCASLISVLVAPAAGAAAPLAMLLTVVGVLAMGWMLSLYARAYVGAGALYHYIRHATNPLIGLFFAGVYFISGLFLGGPTLCIIVGLFAAPLLAAVHLQLAWWIIALVVAVWTWIINYVGVQWSTRTQLILTAGSAVPLLLTVGAVLWAGGDAGQLTFPVPAASDGTAGLLHGIFFAVTLFSGIESAAALGEETAHPRRTIPRAIGGAILITGVLYLLVTYASAIGFGAAHVERWASDPAALNTLAARYVGAWLTPLLDLAIIIDLLAMASAFTALSARGWFALARDGLLPRVLSRTSGRFGTPVGGNTLVLAITLIGIVSAAVTNTDPVLALYIGAGAGGLLLLAMYTALAVVAVRFVRGAPGAWWRWPLLGVAFATPVCGLYGALVPLPSGPAMLGVYGAACGVMLAAVWTLVIARFLPHRLTIVVPADRHA